MRNIIRTVGKRNAIFAGLAVVILVSAAVSIQLIRGRLSEPVMLAKVKNNTTSESCIQTVKNESLSISPAEYELIVNAAALGILDVPAGTNADVYIRDYTDSKAGGTVIYSGTYGSYNFTASKEASKDSGSFTGGWSAHDFQACKR